MAEPRIQYCKTSDGVNIAYSVRGDGPPLVVVSALWGTLHMRRSFPDGWERSFDAFNRRLVLYDGRGRGASEHGTTDYSPQAQLTDLVAVVDHLELEKFPLYAHSQAVPTAITFSTTHAERVTRLVLAEGYASAGDWYTQVPTLRVLTGLTGMVRDEWESYTLALASAVLEYASAEAASRWASACRASMSPEEFLAYHRQSMDVEVTGLLNDVRAPTLLVHFTDGPKGGLPLMREMAAAIPDASLVEVTVDESGEIVRQFLDEDEAARREFPSGMTAILFADIADSTALTETLGDAAFRAKARDLDAALRGIIRDHAGTTIDAKTLGDGVLATFASASQAITAALACASAGDDAGLPLHLGLHAGDVIREDNNVFGGAVNIAARVSAQAAPGEVLVSDIVRGLARTSAGVSFDDRGERELKGVAEAVRVFAVGLSTGSRLGE
jgi:class 3 adenylate cyclase